MVSCSTQVALRDDLVASKGDTQRADDLKDLVYVGIAIPNRSI